MINWKLILSYIAFIWLFAYGFMTLSYLFDSDLAELIRHSANPEVELNQKQHSTASLTKLILLSRFAYLLGCFLAFTLTFFTARIKPKFYWLHSIIALMVFIVLNLADLTGWSFFKIIFLAPGQLANGIWYYLINGGIMIAIGTSLLLGSRSMASDSVPKVESSLLINRR
jgi:hypothetical protein